MGENLIGVGSGEKRLRGTGDKKQLQVVTYSKTDMDDHQHTGKPCTPALPRLEWNSGSGSPDHLSTWPLGQWQHEQQRTHSLSKEALFPFPHPKPAHFTTPRKMVLGWGRESTRVGAGRAHLPFLCMPLLQPEHGSLSMPQFPGLTMGI